MWRGIRKGNAEEDVESEQTDEDEDLVFGVFCSVGVGGSGRDWGGIRLLPFTEELPVLRRKTDENIRPQLAPELPPTYSGSAPDVRLRKPIPFTRSSAFTVSLFLASPNPVSLGIALSTLGVS